MSSETDCCESAGLSPDARAGDLALGLRLEWLTIGYNVLEAVAAVAAGFFAGSIALVGFGFDSVIEVAAATVVLWRLKVEFAGGDPEAHERAETRALRFVGSTFLLLAAYVLYESARSLIGGEAPSESVPGIVIAVLSLIVMPALAVAKRRVADRIGSRSLRADAMETFVCAWLSFALLLGLALNALLGWWWADPIAAAAMIPLMVKEGLEGLRGEACCD